MKKTRSPRMILSILKLCYILRMKIFTLFITIVLCSGFASQSNAEAIKPTPNLLILNPKSDLNITPSHGKDIAFAFTKLSGKIPDFKGILEQSPAFQTADQATKNKMILEDIPIFEMEFHNLDITTKPIIIRTNVTTKASVGTNNGLIVEFGNDTKTPVYFPYHWGGQNYAVLVHGIDTFKLLPMTMETASNTSRKIKNNRAILILELKPHSADALRPMVLDGIAQYLLLTEIKRARLVNEYYEVLWEYKS
jgi:hypothetical protein